MCVCLVIQQTQRSSYDTHAGLEGDVRNLPFEAETFDVLLDKGTMDAMMTSKGDVWVHPKWVFRERSLTDRKCPQNPPKADIENCNKEVDEALRVLRPGGLFLYITFGQPHFRKRYLTRPNTTLKVRGTLCIDGAVRSTAEKFSTELKTQGFSYFLYEMRKTS